MKKINRNWAILCETGDQMNRVWQVLKDAGENLLSESPHYDGEGFRVMAFNSVEWSGYFNSCSPGIFGHTKILFDEFMDIMKPGYFDEPPKSNNEDSDSDEIFIEKNDTVVTDLLEYLDRPELIQHKSGKQVRALHHFPKNGKSLEVLVVFEGGQTTFYYRDGSYLERGSDPQFVLIRKPKEVVTGWRRPVIINDRIILSSNALPTKEDFMRGYGDQNYEFGPWEQVTVEICEE